MTFEEYYERIDRTNRLNYSSYWFLVDRNGDSLVIKFDGDPYAITEFRTYPKRSSPPTAEDFAKIEVGMDFFEVVELVGLPYDTAGSGMVYLCFFSADGNGYGIYSTDDTVNGMLD